MPRMTTSLLTTAAVATLLALTACAAPGGEPVGSGDGASAPAEEPSTGERPAIPQQTLGSEVDCSLYSFEDITAIWGVTITDTDSGTVIERGGTGGLLYSCDYNETDSGLGLTVTIEYREFPSAEEAAAEMDVIRSSASFGDQVFFVNEDVPGVADDAFFSWSANAADDPDRVQDQLYAQSGNVLMLLSAVNLDGVAADYTDKLVATVDARF